MSEPKAPLKFKFVGGPSRKRRRCAPPSTSKAASRPTQARSGGPALGPSNSASTHSWRHHYARQAPSKTTGADSTANVASSQAGSPDGPACTTAAANAPPPASELFESLLDWLPSADMSTNANPVLPGLELNDPSNLMGFPFDLPTFPSPSLNSNAVHRPPLVDRLGRCLSGDQRASTPDRSSHPSEDIDRETRQETEDPKSIPGTISDTTNRLFTQYDREFCVWPLTHDFEANPFRCDVKNGRSSPLLWHSILALSYKHIHHETGSCLEAAERHKSKALKLFERLEADLASAKARENLLDGLLILMTLDCATSAQGPWVSHLRRARKIFESLKEIGTQNTPRMQAQVDMLAWWDVTLGLTTRQGFVLSRAMFDSVLRPNSGSTFYNISGCPAELFRYMFWLGTYAQEFELASHMTCVTFDMSPVLAVEDAIKAWRAPQYDDSDADFTQLPDGVDLPKDWCLHPVETAHYVQDLYHSAQAWRFALLVYIERVFKWRHGSASHVRMSLLARKALNNALSCRRSVMIQKQLLLPVFLAACEIEDETLREAARDYCSWWSDKTRYDMFVTTLGLLEEIWTAADSDANIWWGSLIDRKSGSGVGTAGASKYSKRQYLFG